MDRGAMNENGGSLGSLPDSGNLGDDLRTWILLDPFTSKAFGPESLGGPAVQEGAKGTTGQKLEGTAVSHVKATSEEVSGRTLPELARYWRDIRSWSRLGLGVWNAGRAALSGPGASSADKNGFLRIRNTGLGQSSCFRAGTLGLG